jgi:hypothetical protein
MATVTTPSPTGASECSSAPDEVRKELAGHRHDDPATADFGQGLYRPATTARTYDEMRQRAHQLLEHGESVILDASWRSSDERDKTVDPEARY